MENTYCLGIDESKAVISNMSEDEAKKAFKYAYYKSFSGAVIIRKADGSDFSSQFDKKHMEFVCYAIPKDYKPKRKTVNYEYSEEVTIIDRVKALKNEFDNISEEAFMFECEIYKPEDFIDPRICKEMWKLGVELETITGWAFYAYTSKAKINSKNAVVPIKARPLLDKEFQSSIYNITFFSEAYLKKDYPEIADISVYAISKTGENGIKRAVNSLILKQNHLSCSKIVRKQGKNSKVIFVYYNDECYATMKEIEILINGELLDFNFEKYMQDNSNRIIIETEDAVRMRDDLKQHKLKISKENGSQ